MKIGLISDTHGTLYAQALEHLRGVAAILHAGDVGHPGILTTLGKIAQTWAVFGNCDGDPFRRQLRSSVVWAGPWGGVGLTHGHLAPEGPDDDWTHNLARLFSALSPAPPRIIVYGHSHIARIEEHDGTLLVNPGSAGRPRFGQKRPPTVAILHLPADSGEPAPGAWPPKVEFLEITEQHPVALAG